jgi:hypothetical protein
MGKRWAPVVRYDTAHRFAHRDIISQKGIVRSKKKGGSLNYDIPDIEISLF